MTLTNYLKGIADAIREKEGTTAPISAQDFSQRIRNLVISGIDTSMVIDTTGLDDVIADRLLLWHDEFDGSSLNTNYWKLAKTGYARNGEIHCNDENHISFNDSVMRLTCEPNLVDGVLTPFTIDGDSHTFKWRCSEVQSKVKIGGDFYLECKMRQIPDTTDSSITTRTGFCPAYWGCGDFQTYEWAFCGEIDFNESPTFNGINSTSHYADKQGLHKAGYLTGGYPSNIDWSTFHKLAYERKGNTITYYFDDVVTKTKTCSEADNDLFYNGINPFKEFPINLIMNIAVGGTASNSATDEQRGINPCAIEFDWIRVYSSKDVAECVKPSSLSLTECFNFDMGASTWNSSTKKLTMRVNDCVNFKYKYGNNYPIYNFDTNCTDETVAIPCATTGSSKYDQSMGVYGLKVGTTKFNYTESMTGLSDSFDVEVKDIPYTAYTKKLENINFATDDLTQLFTSGQFTGYSSVMKLDQSTSSKHMAISRPIPVTAGKTYLFKMPRWKQKGIIVLTSGNIVLGTTKFADYRPSGSTWTQTTSTKDDNFKVDYSYANIEFTVPADGTHVIIWGGDVDSNNRRWAYTHVIRDAKEALEIVSEEVTEKPCTGITLSDTTLEFTTTESKTLTATLTPTDTTDVVVWSINNSLATVSNGIITPVGGSGTATVTATCGSETATCECTFNISGGEPSVDDEYDIYEWNGASELGDFTLGSNTTMSNSAEYGNYITGTNLYANSAYGIRLNDVLLNTYDSYIEADFVILNDLTTGTTNGRRYASVAMGITSSASKDFSISGNGTNTNLFTDANISETVGTKFTMKYINKTADGVPNKVSKIIYDSDNNVAYTQDTSVNSQTSAIPNCTGVVCNQNVGITRVKVAVKKTS